jgi:hypothetical protein
MFSVFLPICIATTAVTAMCKCYGRVLGVRFETQIQFFIRWVNLNFLIVLLTVKRPCPERSNSTLPSAILSTLHALHNTVKVTSSFCNHISADPPTWSPRIWYCAAWSGYLTSGGDKWLWSNCGIMIIRGKPKTALDQSGLASLVHHEYHMTLPRFGVRKPESSCMSSDVGTQRWKHLERKTDRYNTKCISDENEEISWDLSACSLVVLRRRIIEKRCVPRWWRQRFPSKQSV